MILASQGITLNLTILERKGHSSISYVQQEGWKTKSYSETEQDPVFFHWFCCSEQTFIKNVLEKCLHGAGGSMRIFLFMDRLNHNN